VLILLALVIPLSVLAALTIDRLASNQQQLATLSSSSVFGPTLAAILGVSTLLAGLLVFVWSRREGKDAAGSATSHHEPTELTDASESIAKRYAQQTRAMSAMTELDRAILSRANVDRLVDCVLQNALEVLNCPLVAVILIDRDTPTKARTVLAQADTPKEMHTEPSDISLETTQYLAARPDGGLLDSLRDDAVLAPLANHGAKQFFFWPVYWEGNVSALIAVGLAEGCALSPDDRTYARDFADRLGVALRANALEDKVRLHAQLDLTTALLTRDSFKNRLSQEVARARRESRQIALLFVDLDQFKKVNDAIGHAQGDALLEQVSLRLKSCLREEDIVARFGGDEFAILLPAIAKGTDAAVVAEKLIVQLAQPFNFGGSEQKLTASVGACICPDDGKSVDAMFRSAERCIVPSQRVAGSMHFSSKALWRRYAIGPHLNRNWPRH